MPMYDYACEKCGNMFTERHTVDKRSAPTQLACESCGCYNTIHIKIGAVPVSYSTHTMRTSDNFNSRLKEIRKKVGKDGKDSLSDNIR